MRVNTELESEDVESNAGSHSSCEQELQQATADISHSVVFKCIGTNRDPKYNKGCVFDNIMSVN